MKTVITTKFINMIDEKSACWMCYKGEVLQTRLILTSGTLNYKSLLTVINMSGQSLERPSTYKTIL